LQRLGHEPAALLGEVEQDGAGFEDGNRRPSAGRIMIDDRRNLPERVDRPIGRLRLLPF
jgi:hypothetical protein